MWDFLALVVSSGLRSISDLHASQIRVPFGSMTWGMLVTGLLLLQTSSVFQRSILAYFWTSKIRVY